MSSPPIVRPGAIARAAEAAVAAKKKPRKRQSEPPPEYVVRGVRDMEKQFPKRLRELRARRSQRQFGRDLGINQQTMNRLENGSIPTAQHLTQMLLAERINLNWLLAGIGDKYLDLD